MLKNLHLLITFRYMKLSQLLIREDFYKLLLKTIYQNSFFKNNIEKKSAIFHSYKYLNIILNKSLNKSVKDELLFEYSLSKSIIKQFLQNVYLKIIFLPVISSLFSEKKILLPTYLNDFGVVPGNHRIRLFEPSLKKIIVLLKHNESVKFIKNDIDTRVNNNLSYAPKIFSYGSDWLSEEFVRGVPYNRVKTNDSKKALKFLIALHSKELIDKNKENISTIQYLNKCKRDLHSLVEIIDNKNLIKKEIILAIDKLVSFILTQNIIEIETSTTHGDFQEGNVRIDSKNKLYVIDWESADNRFFLYDIFVILSGIRTEIELDKAFELFFQNVQKFKIDINNYSKYSLVTILCFEEFRFHLNEDITKNYFSPGRNSMNKFIKINTFISNLSSKKYE